ncbi:MAG TPA: hypothetical protein VE010_19490 [Thermoanaerobaculia bacterium]|nr:hypothetical protein [Thermoanaerobaculia bacterium]
MRVRSLTAVALLSCIVAVPALPQPAKESFAATLAKSAGSSVASAGGLAVAKALTGKFYDATCAKEATKDVPEQYFCNALGGFSGRDEQEWKQQIEQQLADIKTSLDVLEKGQARLQFDLNQQHKEMYRLFRQAAAEQIATSNEAEFETLWKEYMRQFDDDLRDVNRTAMLKLAKKILGRDLDDKLALYNTVLTTSFRGNQALLRYPFYDYKEKHAYTAPFFNRDNSFDKVYEGAERAFVDSRARQEKVYAMVLWAIKVLELDCELNKRCEAPPITAADFRKTFDAYTKEQVIAFNEGLHWVLLAYGDARGDAWFLSGRAEEFLTRANVLNAALVGTGEGAWGQVISMGNAWDGAISVQCGAISGKITPRLNYVVPVTGRYGETEIDWWVSRAGNAVYDEVRFAKEWKVYHYYLPAAKAGACTVSNALPGKGIMPWVQPGTSVMRVRTADEREITFGSFLAIQRAGGTYAMTSGGQWRKRNEPINSDDGTTANLTNARFDWTIVTNGRLPHAAVLFEGRGEYKMGRARGGRVRKYNQIYLYNDKKIYFPQDRQVKLGLVQGGDCAKTCRNSLSAEIFVLDYNIANGADSALNAVASVFLHPTVSDPNVKGADLRRRAEGSGVYVDGSYDQTKDRRQKTVEGMIVGAVKTDPNTAYHLQYLLELDLSTEGPGIDATEWVYRAKITPAMLYVAK